MKTLRYLGAILALVGAPLVCGVTQASADTVSGNSASASALGAPHAASLASCSAHYSNTAAWMDCTGGSEKSMVRLGYNCGIPPFDRDVHTRWESLSPGQTKTISGECTVRVNNAWPNVRPY